MVEIKYRYGSSQSGFTLIELMVTVAVLAVLATIAAPSFTEILSSLRVRTAAYSLISDLSLARSEAVKRGVAVVVSPSAQGWSAGWTIVANTTPTATTLTEQISSGNGVQFLSSPGSVTFGADGRSNSATTVRFSVTNNHSKSVCISLDPTGAPRSVNRVCT
jgi:type IV fimbrial biogenesis protein FimT